MRKRENAGRFRAPLFRAARRRAPLIGESRRRAARARRFRKFCGNGNVTVRYAGCDMLHHLSIGRRAGGARRPRAPLPEILRKRKRLLRVCHHHAPPSIESSFSFGCYHRRLALVGRRNVASCKMYGALTVLVHVTYPRPCVLAHVGPSVKSFRIFAIFRLQSLSPLARAGASLRPGQNACEAAGRHRGARARPGRPRLGRTRGARTPPACSLSYEVGWLAGSRGARVRRDAPRSDRSIDRSMPPTAWTPLRVAPLRT